MLFDILTVLVVTLISSLFLRTTSVHGLPKLPSTHHTIRHHHPSADFSSSLRLLRQQHPVPSVDYDLGGDLSQMLIGESNELSTTTTNDHNDDLTSTSSLISSIDASNVPLEFYFQRLPSKILSRKLALSLKKHQEEKQEYKRASPPSISALPSLPPELTNLNAAVAAAAFADPSDPNSVVSLSQLSESTRLSPSLKALVETNPFARAWLTMLLQKVLEEQPVPYIFKYGRRRK